jgi:uncharacterized membrane-anchored protein
VTATIKKPDKDNRVAATNKNQTMTITWQQQINKQEKDNQVTTTHEKQDKNNHVATTHEKPDKDNHVALSLDCLSLVCLFVAAT